MSFTFLSTAAVLGGIGVLAVLLGILQRLRVLASGNRGCQYSVLAGCGGGNTGACVRQTISTLASVVAHCHDRVVFVALVCGPR